MRVKTNVGAGFSGISLPGTEGTLVPSKVHTVYGYSYSYDVEMPRCWATAPATSAK